MYELYVLVRAISGHGYEFKSVKTGAVVVYPIAQIVGSARRDRGKVFKLVQQTMIVAPELTATR